MGDDRLGGIRYDGLILTVINSKTSDSGEVKMSVVQFSARGLELQGNLSRFQPNFATLRPDFEYQVRVEPRPSGEELAREFREMMDNAQRAPEDVGKSEEEIMEEVIAEIAGMRAEDRRKI